MQPVWISLVQGSRTLPWDAGLLQQRAQGKVLAASVRGGRHWVSAIPSLPARLEEVA